MASDAKSTVYAKFSSIWKIEWAEFERVLTTKNFGKRLVTTYKNVPLFWRIRFASNHGTFDVYFHYIDGAAEKVENVISSIALLKNGLIVNDCKRSDADYNGMTFRYKGFYFAWGHLGARDSGAFQAAYGLNRSEPLEFLITLKIPISVFSFKMADPCITTPKPCSDFLREGFQNIEDPNESQAWNAKLTSRDGTAFYCHGGILGLQSKELAAMLRYPPASNAKPGEYPYPILGIFPDTMKAFLEFIYTGQTTKVANLSTTADIIDLAHETEQFDLKRLKEAFGSALWIRVVEHPDDCFSIMQFADLLDGMKYLKHRAMDVLYENWEKFKKYASIAQLHGRFGSGVQGDNLRAEHDDYARQRLEPTDFSTLIIE